MLPRPFGRTAAGLLAAALLVGAAPARAADFDKLEVASLKEMPADAAYYSTLLRNKEQLDLVLNSKAWKKFTALPGVQTAWQAAMREFEKPNGPKEKYDDFVKDPQNQELVDLLADMVSHEVYFYGGPNTPGFVQLSGELYSAAIYGSLMGQLTGNPKNLTPQEMSQAAVFRVLARNTDLIKVPEMVVGFKTTKADAAEKQIKRVEDLLNLAAAFQPDLKGRVKRVKAGGGDFVTLNLDGEMVPWDDVLKDMKAHEEKPGEFDAVVKKLKAQKLTVGLGVRKGYVLLLVGDSVNLVEKFGGQGKRLLDQPELKPLAKHAGQRLTSVSYVSKALNAQFAPNKKDLQKYGELANAWLPKIEGLTDAQKGRLKKDLEQLAKDLESYVPEPGATLGFAFLTPRGKESYAYDWGQNLAADASKPLSLLEHVGGDPLVAVVGRSKTSPDEWNKVVKWAKLANAWAEELILPKLTDEQKAVADKVGKVVYPLWKRVDAATGKMLLPALQDGQAAFVLDAKLTSKSLFPAMPPADKPLPILEPALIFGVSDPEQLTKAFAEYRSIINDGIKGLRKLKDDVPEFEKIPEFEVPAPGTRQVKGGTLYFYKLPAEWNLDAQIFPNAGVGARVAVLTISEEHSVRLLNPAPLKVQGSPLADPKKKLSGAAYVNWAGLVDALVPWIDYGVDQAPNAGFFNKDDIMKHVKVTAEVLKCFRSTASATYEEDGATVTHSETIIRDIQ